jgi:hypothetical protein
VLSDIPAIVTIWNRDVIPATLTTLKKWLTDIPAIMTTWWRTGHSGNADHGIIHATTDIPAMLTTL